MHRLDVVVRNDAPASASTPDNPQNRAINPRHTNLHAALVEPGHGHLVIDDCDGGLQSSAHTGRSSIGWGNYDPNTKSLKLRCVQHVLRVILPLSHDTSHSITYPTHHHTTHDTITERHTGPTCVGPGSGWGCTYFIRSEEQRTERKKPTHPTHNHNQ